MQNTLNNLFKSVVFRPSFGLLNMKKAGRDFKGMRVQQEIYKKDLKKLDKRDEFIIRDNYKNGFTHEELKDSNEMVRKVFALNNASPKEILKFKIQKAVEKFQKSPNDTSSTGVQIAVMTERIYHLLGHTEGMRKDVKAARYLNQLLDHRRKKLNYLRQKDYHFYKYVITEYNIPENPPLNHHERDSYRLFRNKVAPMAPQRR